MRKFFVDIKAGKLDILSDLDEHTGLCKFLRNIATNI